MLRFNSLKKEYSTTTVLHVPSLVIQNGTILLQGENGSGKTTFLKIIAGLLPFEGDIFIDDLFSLKKQRQSFIRNINYAEAEPLYPPFLTAKELVRLFCYAKRGNIKDIEALLQQLHLFGVYTKAVSTYSSGMLKKLSLALAFAGSPKWILLDEPLITIDKNAVETICDIINNKSKAGISFIITSHQHFTEGLLSFSSVLRAANKTITIVE
jgi:ABC-2 type transport system ATP-binding protein